MPRSITVQAGHGAHELVDAAEHMLDKAIADHGSRAPFSFPNTVYYLPIILGQSAKPVERLGDLRDVMKQARGLLGSGTLGSKQVPDQSLAALLAAETMEALRVADRQAQPSGKMPPTSVAFESPVSDAQTRVWGIQLTDGRIAGIAVLVGCAKNSAATERLIRELRRYNILCFLSGNAHGHSIIDQAQEAGLDLGEQAFIVPLGAEASSAAHALGFATRCAMKLGGARPGMWPEILKYTKRRTPGFVVALGELSDADYAVALAAKDFGFAVIADIAAPGAGEFISMPFEALTGINDEERAAGLAERCIAAAGLSVRSYGVNLPLEYGPAFEDEDVGDADLYVQFGGAGTRAFELLQTAGMSEVVDGKIEVIGPDLSDLGAQPHAPLAIVVRVAGKRLQKDYEPLLERQVQGFLNYINGVRHSGHEDAITLRISKAACKDLDLKSFGRVLHTRFHEEFAAVEKAEVTLITEPQRIVEWEATARDVHDRRSKFLASLTDSQVDEFFVCTNCRAFAPGNVSVITPERISPCGQCNWLDAKAGYEMKSTSVRQPIKPGKPIDLEKGIWEGINEYARTASHGRIKEVALYSVAQSPMSACADFECIVMMVPEVNGVMVVSHDDASATPAGVTVETFASIAAGEQIPGVVGIGKNHLLSPKFIAAEGGFKRVVWMSSTLKESMAAELQAVCAREGDPDFMDKIADEHQVTAVQDLIPWLREHKHPALEMERMF